MEENQTRSKHWADMNCVLNSSLIEKSNQHAFYISENEPPDFILPAGITYIIYHPLHMDGQLGNAPDEETKLRIMEFIRVNDCTDSGNVTELSRESLDRLFLTPSVMAVLFSSLESECGTSSTSRKDDKIIGTMISPIFRAQYGDFSLLTSYTTFLCVAKDYREKGLAMILIRAVMKEGYTRYGINHGYYMTFTPHHSISNEIKSWYRPINIKKAGEAGFTLQTFSAKGDRGNSSTHQRLAYHIPKPSVLPIKATPESYDLVMKILRQGCSSGKLCLTPTKQEFDWLCNCFDIYIVGTASLFMLFPMSSIISSTGKRVRNAQVALMIGDVLSHALWIANENKYDLLYGWCGGDITREKVVAIKGLITVARSFVELYNSKFNIPNNSMSVPLF